MFRKEKIIAFLFCFQLLFCNLFAGENIDISFAIQAIQIQDIIKSQLSPGADWSLVAIDLETGKKLVDAKETENDLMIPGSLVKLFVTAAILDKSAAAPIDLDTVVAISGSVVHEKLSGNVIIRGCGNAFLASRDLLFGIEKLQALGIKEINGDIVVDASLFEIKEWKDKYRGAAYGVPSALGLDLHTVSISVEAAKREAVADPPNDMVNVRYRKAGKPGIRQINDYLYEVSGAATGSPVLRKRFSLADPAHYAGGTLLTLLKREGIAVSGKLRRGRMPADAREIARIGSPAIDRVVLDTNRESLNVSADNMLLLLGAIESGAPGSREKGAQAVRNFLDTLGVPVSGMSVVDGSGVSERNKASAEQMTTFLRAVSKRSWFPAFYGSLSRPGIDGRVRDFEYKSQHIRAKAGQLPQSYCLAGYVDRVDGRKIAFSYFLKEKNLDILRAVSTSSEVLRRLEGK